jgi:hypothetical protein
MKIFSSFGDAAYNVVNDWVATLEGDPVVNVMFIPPQNIALMVICPPMATWAPILCEASSIAHHYAPLQADDFSPDFPHHPVNPIPGPLDAPVGNVQVHHADLALTAIHARNSQLTFW